MSSDPIPSILLVGCGRMGSAMLSGWREQGLSRSFAVDPAPQAASPAPGAQVQQPYWFYCQDTQTYFPHVQNCASPWQRVMPHAPQQTQ